MLIVLTTLPEHMSSTPVFVFLSRKFCVIFNRSLFVFLPLFLLAFVLSVLLQLMASDTEPFGCYTFRIWYYFERTWIWSIQSTLKWILQDYVRYRPQSWVNRKSKQNIIKIYANGRLLDPVRHRPNTVKSAHAVTSIK